VKILVALDHSNASQETLGFVKNIFGTAQPENLQLVLFHVVESLPQFSFAPPKDDKSANAIEAANAAWDSAHETAGEELIAASLKSLVEAGIPESCIGSQICTRESFPKARKTVAALAIIDEMQSGDYQVVCIGRRGSTEYDSVFLGSTAEKVLREAHGKTVWVVDT